MSIRLDVQYASQDDALPDKDRISNWVYEALNNERDSAEITIRIVDHDEGTALNQQWREGKGPANVLSFPAEGLEDIEPDLLGDVVICAPVVQEEARDQGKPADSHWAHMVIHGTLHLIGYDHTNDNDTQEMESLEINILEKLGYPDPYS